MLLVLILCSILSYHLNQMITRLSVSFSLTPPPLLSPSPPPHPNSYFVFYFYSCFVFYFHFHNTHCCFFFQTGLQVAPTSLPQTRVFLANVVIQVLLDWTVDWAWDRAMGRSSTVGRWPTWTSLAATVRPLHCSVMDWHPCSTHTCSESSQYRRQQSKMSTLWKASGDGLDKPWYQRCWTSCCRGQEKSQKWRQQATARCVAWYCMLPDSNKMCCLVLRVAWPNQDVLPGIPCCQAKARCVAWYYMLPGHATRRPSRGVWWRSSNIAADHEWNKNFQRSLMKELRHYSTSCNKEKTFQRSLMEELEYCRTSWMQQEDLPGKSDQGTRTLQHLMQQAELPEESSGDVLQSNIQRREDSLPQESGGERGAGRQNVKWWQEKDVTEKSLGTPPSKWVMEKGLKDHRVPCREEKWTFQKSGGYVVVA